MPILLQAISRRLCQTAILVLLTWHNTISNHQLAQIKPPVKFNILLDAFKVKTWLHEFVSTIVKPVDSENCTITYFNKTKWYSRTYLEPVYILQYFRACRELVYICWYFRAWGEPVYIHWYFRAYGNQSTYSDTSEHVWNQSTYSLTSEHVGNQSTYTGSSEHIGNQLNSDTPVYLGNQPRATRRMVYHKAVPVSPATVTWCLCW